MKSLFAAALIVGLGCAPAIAADDISSTVSTPMPVTPVPANGLGSDVFVVLVSDTMFGPDHEDANVAARFYCSTRGKLATFVGKQHPPEMRTTVFQEWSLLTFRCVEAATNSAPQAAATPPAQ